MQVKTSELTGHTLMWAVNQCELTRLVQSGEYVKSWVLNDHRKGHTRDLCELTAVEIIGRERIALDPDHALGWWAGEGSNTPMFQRVGVTGSSPVEAAMRYYVLKTLGPEIEIPDNLYV